MYEALHEIISPLAQNDEEGLIEHTETMVKAREALAKATGRIMKSEFAEKPLTRFIE
ncbi:MULTISPECIES: hypothetical protein [Nitrosomonas]|uniref:hypothetical protein n=1 Tax=Nitrosomonas TaxID=914 RepID=UPI00130532B5|nr:MULTISPECIES: hypothetical protein [Nitrosomonas]QOJ08646.1 MAG: hypothetical protein HRU73_03615 [Nitrosomonas sp. H1_AOB3]